MKFLSFEVLPLGASGWGSGSLDFGERVTQLYGANGSGKTPIIKSMMYCLGYPVSFRDDIYEHCRAARLRFECKGRLIELTRSYGERFDASIDINDQISRYFSEEEYSRAIFDLLGKDFPYLVANSSQPVRPYMSTFLPLFYLEQNHGYSEIYKCPKGNFIKNQYSEMVRIALGISPQNAYEKKKLLLELKDNLDAIDRLIADKAKSIDFLSREIGGDKRSIADIDREIDEVKRELGGLRAGRGGSDEALVAIDSLISEKRRGISRIRSEINQNGIVLEGMERIKREIDSEISTLSLNEEARDIFSEFSDICSNASCGLFLASRESYGKNLLYLKDQLKDVVVSAEDVVRKNAELDVLLKKYEFELSEVVRQRESLEKAKGVDGLVDAIGRLTVRLFELESMRRAVDRLNEEENAYLALGNRREDIQNRLGGLSGGGASDELSLIRARNEFRELIIKWLDVLKATSISREVHIGPDFLPTFGNEVLSQFDGSTRVRVVLAVHAAFFEMYIKDPAREFRVMILDTPKQQELHTQDLSRYIDSLVEVAGKGGAQLVFSTTEYHYPCSELDNEWRAEFEGPEQMMYLG